MVPRWFYLSVDGWQMDAYYAELDQDSRAWGFTALDESGKPVGSFKMAAADYEADSVRYGIHCPGTGGKRPRSGTQMVAMAAA